VPSVRSRLVSAKSRSKWRRSIPLIEVSSWMIASGQYCRRLGGLLGVERVRHTGVARAPSPRLALSRSWSSRDLVPARPAAARAACPSLQLAPAHKHFHFASFRVVTRLDGLAERRCDRNFERLGALTR